MACQYCQYALLRLALPNFVSTTVMTGDLPNAVLALTDLLLRHRSLIATGSGQLKEPLRLLVGFLMGCLVTAAAAYFLADWATMLVDAAAMSQAHG